MKDRIWRNEHIYAAFDRIIRLFEKRVEGKIPVINGFHKEVLEQRIVQRFVQLLYYPFCILAKQRLKAGGNPLPGKDETMLLNRVTISAATGKISPNTTFIFILFADFFWEWLQAIEGI